MVNPRLSGYPDAARCQVPPFWRGRISGAADHRRTTAKPSALPQNADRKYTVLKIPAYNESVATNVTVSDRHCALTDRNIGDAIEKAIKRSHLAGHLGRNFILVSDDMRALMNPAGVIVLRQQR